jgi:hypothetical protein
MGYVSDGTVLTKRYTFRKTNTITGVLAYSASLLTSDTTDPNDGLKYFVSMSGTWAAPSDGAKVYRDNDLDDTPEAAKQVTGGTSATMYDTADAFGSDFPDNLNVTPNGVAATTLFLEKDGSGLAPHLITKGTDDAARHEWQNSTGVVKGTAFMDTNGVSHTGLVGLTFVAMSAASVPNNTLFRNTATGKLSYKDNSGTTNALY